MAHGTARMLNIGQAAPVFYEILTQILRKNRGVQTMKMGPQLAYYLRFAVLETEVCQHDKATGSVGDETYHTACALGRTGILFAAAGLLRAPAGARQAPL